MQDRSKQHHQQQAGMEQSEWSIRIKSYEPLETAVGVLSLETGDSRSLQMKLQEEGKGILFKEQGRIFEIANAEGKGGMLCKKHVDKKVKCYGTFSNIKGKWSMHVLACEPQESEGEMDKQDQGQQDEKSMDKQQKPGQGQQQTPDKQQKPDQGQQPDKSMDKQPLYQCPMHPEITARQPARCSKCGMDLLKKEKQ